MDELEAERKDSQRTILSLTADVDRLQRSHVPKNASSTERHAQQTQRSPIFEASTPGSHRHQAEAYSPVMPIDDNVDTPNDEPLSPNARLLSSLLTSRNGDASSRSQAGANMESGGSTRSTAHVSPPAVKSTRAASTEQLIEKLEQSLNITGSDTDDGDTVADDRWQRRANRDRGTTSVLGHIYSSGSLYQPSLSDRTAEVHSSGGSEFMSQKTASTTVAEHTTDQSLVPRSNAIAKSKDSLYSASEELQRYLQRLESNVD